MVILSLYWGNLGVKWRNGVAYKSKNAKIEIGLNPPPLTLNRLGDFANKDGWGGGGKLYPPA